MSGRYRYEPSNGWLWILPPVGPSFASVYEKSASGADSNTRAVREIVIELNRLLDRAVYAESHRLTAETALDEAIARADKASNALIRTTAALRETTDRAEKAEARVAELEREVAAWSPARHYGPEDEVYDDPKPEPSVAELQQRIATAKVGYYAPCVWCWSTVFAPNGEQVTCHKCGRKTPVPAPEGTETGQKSPPPSPVGAPRSDQGAGIKSDTQSPGPGRSDPRASESSNLDTKRRATTCEDVKCPCVEEHGPVTLTDEDRVDRVDLTKPQTLRAYATFGEASPENSIRILVDPAAAAEVEARTGAYGRGLTKDEDAAYEAVLHGFMRDAMKGLDESMIGAIHEDAPCEIATLRMHPRAGLPSRDEVAAFLEARWPTDPRKPCVDPDCLVCRMGL